MMSSIISTIARSSRVIRASPVLSKVLTKGISTQELDTAKGGKLAALSHQSPQLPNTSTDRERVVILGSG
jgi:hypothetical protein